MKKFLCASLVSVVVAAFAAAANSQEAPVPSAPSAPVVEGPINVIIGPCDTHGLKSSAVSALRRASTFSLLWVAPTDQLKASLAYFVTAIS